MNRAGVTLIAGAAALLVIGVLVKHSRHTAAEPRDVPQAQFATTSGERGGTERRDWRANTGADTNAVAGRKGRSSSDWGSGRVAGRGHAGARGSGSHAAYPGSDAIHAESSVAPLGAEGGGAGLSQGMHVARQLSNNSAQEVATNPNSAAEPAGKEAHDGVLLSIPFRDGVNAEVGGTGMQANGLVSKNDGVEFNEQSRLSLPADGHVQSEAGTITLEVTAAWGGGESSNQSLLTIGGADTTENALQLVKNATGLVLMVRDATGVQQYVRFPLDNWSDSDPHRVAATWDAQTQSVALYVFRELIGSAPYGGFTINDKTLLHIGSDQAGGWPALRGTLGSVKVLDKVLGPDEVADQ